LLKRAEDGSPKQTLSDAERSADQTIADIQIALRKLEDDIADMEARAAKTLDGKPVFRTADGRVVNADGEQLPPEIAAGIQWPANAPNAEDYFAAKQRQGELIAGLEEWQGYRNDTLGGIRDRYEDRENPMSKDDLRAAQDAIEQSTPAISGLEITPASVEVQPAVSATSQNIPTTLR